MTFFNFYASRFDKGNRAGNGIRRSGNIGNERIDFIFRQALNASGADTKFYVKPFYRLAQNRAAGRVIRKTQNERAAAVRPARHIFKSGIISAKYAQENRALPEPSATKNIVDRPRIRNAPVIKNGDNRTRIAPLPSAA